MTDLIQEPNRVMAVCDRLPDNVADTIKEMVLTLEKETGLRAASLGLTIGSPDAQGISLVVSLVPNNGDLMKTRG